MKKEYYDLIVRHFPPGEILKYDDFICDEIVNSVSDDHRKVDEIFELISCSWTDINWEKIENFKYHDYDLTEHIGYCVLQDMNRESFIHVFPSLLNLSTPE